GTADVTRELPIQFRYVKDIYNGDKRMELNVVPAFSVRTTPPLAVMPMAARTIEREIHVSVTNGTRGAADVTVALELPAGWKATTATSTSSLSREDKSLSARFEVPA